MSTLLRTDDAVKLALTGINLAVNNLGRYTKSELYRLMPNYIADAIGDKIPFSSTLKAIVRQGVKDSLNNFYFLQAPRFEEMIDNAGQKCYTAIRAKKLRQSGTIKARAKRKAATRPTPPPDATAEDAFDPKQVTMIAF